MLTTSLCDYNDANIILKGTITVLNTETPLAPKNADEKVIHEAFAPFTSCISRTNNKQIDHSQYIDGVMAMYNLMYNIWKFFF